MTVPTTNKRRICVRLPWPGVRTRAYAAAVLLSARKIVRFAADFGGTNNGGLVKWALGVPASVAAWPKGRCMKPNLAVHSYPWYIGDWRDSETRMLNLAVRGLYRDCIDYMYRTGSLSGMNS
jgi:hypothetical protein